MKAQTFMEYYKQFYGLIDHDNKIDTYFDFVSQPFRSEMIVELFEGFEVEKSAKATYFSKRGKNNILYEFCFFLSQVDVYRLKRGTLDYLHLIPKTLNDFIGDCQRADIELVFKKEISSKF